MGIYVCMMQACCGCRRGDDMCWSSGRGTR